MKAIALKIALTTLLPIAAIAQSQHKINNIGGNINHSTIIQDSEINHTEKHYHFKSKIDTKEILKGLTNHFSEASSDRAFRNQKYRLAAEILQEAYETAISTKQPKKIVLSILSKKSIAESYFDKTTSYNTLLEAIKLNRREISLQEAAANTAIDIYRFDLAKNHIESILKSRQIELNPTLYRMQRYEANFKLHVISTLERRANESVKYAINCSRIFRTELTPEEQDEVKANQALILQVAIHAAAQMSSFPKELLSEYSSAHKVINPKRKFDFLGTDKEGIWISMSEGKPLTQEASTSQTEFSVFEGTQENPSYSIGTSLESITKPIAETISNKGGSNNLSERDVLRVFLSLQEELIEVTSRCKDCAIAPLGSSLGLIMIAATHESFLDYESAHFYYSLALRRLQKSNDYLRSTPHYRFTIVNLYQKIGSTRGEIIGGIGFLANKEALQGPFIAAIKLIEDLSIEQDNSTEFIAKEIELRKLYSDNLVNTLNFNEVKNQCTKVLNLFTRLNNNAYTIDRKTITFYLNCTKKLIVLYKQDNEPDKSDATKKQFIDSIKSFNPTLDPLKLLGET